MLIKVASTLTSVVLTFHKPHNKNDKTWSVIKAQVYWKTIVAAQFIPNHLSCFSLFSFHHWCILDVKQCLMCTAHFSRPNAWQLSRNAPHYILLYSVHWLQLYIWRNTLWQNSALRGHGLKRLTNKWHNEMVRDEKESGLRQQKNKLFISWGSL